MNAVHARAKRGVRTMAPAPAVAALRKANPKLGLAQPLINAKGEYTIEDALHRDAVDFLSRALPPGRRVVWFHCPNGGWRDAKTATMLKAFGVLPGILDLGFFWWDEVPRSSPAIGWIELKAAGGTLSAEQRQFIADVTRLGHRVAPVARNLEQVIAGLDAIGIPGRARVSA